MGTGNWSINGGVTVILEEDVSDPGWYETLLEHMEDCLSIAWSPVVDTWHDRHSKVQFRSSVSEIITHGDDYGNLFICFKTRDDDCSPLSYGLAAQHNDKWAHSFFNKLQGHYPEMRVATSAWTSEPRRIR